MGLLKSIYGLVLWDNYEKSFTYIIVIALFLRVQYRIICIGTGKFTVYANTVAEIIN